MFGLKASRKSMALWVRLVCYLDRVLVAEYIDLFSRSRLYDETPLAVGSTR